MKYLKTIALAVLLTSCAQSGYKKFYHPYIDAKKTSNVVLLEQGEEPKIYGTDNFKRDIHILRSKNYLPVGYSSFNGKYEDKSNIISQARSIGATIVLVKSKYTNTQTNTSTLFLPDNRTTYHSGTGRANTSYNSAYSGYLGSSSTNASYSGTSTTYGTKAVPITSHQRRYDQSAFYLVKSTKKYKYGISPKDLTPELRKELQRNTGVLIDVVFEGTPAFYSNVLAGDVLIAIGGMPVHDKEHTGSVIKRLDPNAASTVFTVIRNGKEKNITITF